MGKQWLFIKHLGIDKNSISRRCFRRHSNIAQDLGETFFPDIKFDRAKFFLKYSI